MIYIEIHIYIHICIYILDVNLYATENFRGVFFPRLKGRWLVGDFLWVGF